jgi:exodeoxyribonuclease VII small subunit
MNNKKTKKFEDCLMRLEEIANLLEGESIGLEEAITLYEEGINLSQECLSTLKNAELKITELRRKVEEVTVEEKDLFDEQ